MTTLQAPKRIGLISNGLGNWALAHVTESDFSVHYIRTDLALPRVKPLKWTEINYDFFAASSSTAVYRVTKSIDGWGWTRWNSGETSTQFFPNSNGAKADAQAHYTRRILSALEDPINEQA